MKSQGNTGLNKNVRFCVALISLVSFVCILLFNPKWFRRARGGYDFYVDPEMSLGIASVIGPQDPSDL